MSKKTTVDFEEDVIDSMTAFMKDEDRKDFGPTVNIVLRRYFKMRDVRGVNDKHDFPAVSTAIRNHNERSK